MPDKAKPLRLRAEDADDLAVMSAALQDAVGKIGDIRFEAQARRLTLTLNRYRWEAGGRSRVRAALQLGSVDGVEARRLRRDAPDAVVELLALTFEPDAEPPGGALILSFAGGGDLRVKVECVDAVLADVSAPWPTPRTPRHET
ncbi:DUF2948 family protein [Phenylobacterium sp.]|uniref:DUF2948 family protein n=1 Tax=Phenylobacterium sp. TaxID=1871053 RepID=UPI004035CDEE